MDENISLQNKIIIAIGQKPASRIVDSTSGIDVDENGFVKTRRKTIWYDYATWSFLWWRCS